MANEQRLDLIDRNVLKTLFDVRYDTAFIQERTRENKEQWNGYCAGINWGRNTIADAPTVDAVEVVHGRWEFVPSEKYGRHYTDAICTACKAVLDTHCDNDLEYRQEKIKKKLLYCPNCGAKMDGGNEDG